MTAAELLDALRSARTNTPDGGEGITVSEMADAGHSGYDAIRRNLRPLVKAGKVRVSRKPMQGMDGVWRQVASYVLIEDAPVKKTKR